MTHADRLKEHLLVKLRRRQHELFDLGAELACPASSIPEGMALLGEEESDRLLEEMESPAEDVPDLTSFILPIGPSPLRVPSHGTDPRKGPGAPSGQVARTSWLRCASCHPAVCQPTLGLGPSSSLVTPRLASVGRNRCGSKSGREMGMPPGNDLDEVLEEVLDGQGMSEMILRPPENGPHCIEGHHALS